MNDKIKEILEMITNKGFKAYVVGGYVRDYLRKIKTNDIDISSIIDETIDKELDNMIILKTNKRKSNLESKKRRKKYRGKNRRFR